MKNGYTGWGVIPVSEDKLWQRAQPHREPVGCSVSVSLLFTNAGCRIPEGLVAMMKSFKIIARHASFSKTATDQIHTGSVGTELTVQSGVNAVFHYHLH